MHPQLKHINCLDGGIGRRARLKLVYLGVWVRFPLQVLNIKKPSEKSEGFLMLKTEQDLIFFWLKKIVFFRGSNIFCRYQVNLFQNTLWFFSKTVFKNYLLQFISRLLYTQSYTFVMFNWLKFRCLKNIFVCEYMWVFEYLFFSRYRYFFVQEF